MVSSPPKDGGSGSIGTPLPLPSNSSLLTSGPILKCPFVNRRSNNASLWSSVISFLYLCANANKHWCQMTGNLISFDPGPETPPVASPISSGFTLAGSTLRNRRKWKTRASMTWYGRAYFFSNRALMKIFVAPPPSVPADDSWAAISQSPLIAAAECRTGTETRTRTAEMMCASRSVQVPLPTKGNRNPLNHAAGLYNPFFKAWNRCTFNFFVSCISSRTRSRITISINRCAVVGVLDTNILVAS
jgi:hypothetical protein